MAESLRSDREDKPTQSPKISRLFQPSSSLSLTNPLDACQVASCRAWNKSSFQRIILTPYRISMRHARDSSVSVLSISKQECVEL